MKKLGQFYKEAREKQKLSISEVSMATKISPKVLQAIESGDEEKLPATTFLKGFLRSYASYLKLDPDEALRLFNEEKKPPLSPLSPMEEKPVSHHVESPVVNEASKASTELPFIKEPSASIKWLSGLGVVLLLFIVIGVNKIIEKYQREGHVVEEVTEEATPPDEEATKAPVVETKPEAKEKSEPIVEAKPTVEAAITPPSQETTKPAEAIKPQEPKTEEIKPPVAETKPETIVEIKPVATTPVAAPTPPPPPEPAKIVETPAKPLAEEIKTTLTDLQKTLPTQESGSQEVILEALDKVEVNIKINDGPSEKLTLTPDQVHTIKLKGKVALELSDGGAVNIIHNGRDRGVPGDLGKPKKVTIP